MSSSDCHCTVVFLGGNHFLLFQIWGFRVWLVCSVGFTFVVFSFLVLNSTIDLVHFKFVSLCSFSFVCKFEVFVFVLVEWIGSFQL